MGSTVRLLIVLLIAAASPLACTTTQVAYEPGPHCDNKAMQVPDDARFRTWRGQAVVDADAADRALAAMKKCGIYHRDFAEQLLQERKDHCGPDCKAKWAAAGAGGLAVAEVIIYLKAVATIFLF